MKAPFSSTGMFSTPSITRTLSSLAIAAPPLSHFPLSKSSENKISTPSISSGSGFPFCSAVNGGCPVSVAVGGGCVPVPGVSVPGCMLVSDPLPAVDPGAAVSAGLGSAELHPTSAASVNKTQIYRQSPLFVFPAANNFFICLIQTSVLPLCRGDICYIYSNIC